MKISYARSYMDLIVAMTCSIFFFLVHFLAQGNTLVIALFGIPALFFIPGYLLTAIIFPRTKRPVEKIISKEQKDIYSSHILKKQKETTKEKKGIDPTIRIALSVGLSLSIIAIVSWVFNSLYNVEPKVFGLRSSSLTLTFFLLSMMFGIWALFLRSRLTEEEREMFAPPKIKLFEKDIKDRVITSVLIILLVIAISAGVYIRFFGEKNDTYTELFLLGPGKLIADYPEIIPTGEPQVLHVGLINHEYRTLEYRVEVSMEGIGTPVQVGSFNDIILNRSSRYQLNLSMDHRDERIIPVIFKVDVPGEHTFVARVLNGDGSIYRQVDWRISVVEEKYLLRDANFSLYLSGQDGSAILLPDSISRSSTISFNIIILNNRDESFPINTTVSSSIASLWVQTFTDPIPVLDDNLGLFDSKRVPSGERSTFPYRFQLQIGNWELIFRVNGRVYLVHHIEVI